MKSFLSAAAVLIALAYPGKTTCAPSAHNSVASVSADADVNGRRPAKAKRLSKKKPKSKAPAKSSIAHLAPQPLSGGAGYKANPQYDAFMKKHAPKK